MKVIIDTDPGNGVPGANVDDGLAIALAVAASEQIELEAITIVSGNTPRDVGYAAADSLLTQFGVTTPIYLGADRALLEPSARWRAHLDAGAHDLRTRALWGGTAEPTAQHAPSAKPAAQAIGELVLAHPGEITIVAIAPLTNIALALRLYPGLAEAIGHLVIMGGVFNVNGYLVDTNFGYDPDAASIVLNSGANITLVPMDVTTRTLMTHADVDGLEQIGGRITQALVPTLRPWVTHSAATRGINGMWIHDVVTVALLLDPSIATASEQSVIIDIAAGPTRGRSAGWTPKMRRLLGTEPIVEPPAVRVLQSIDNARLLDLITTTFTRRVQADSASHLTAGRV